jgi:hypothetical protein
MQHEHSNKITISIRNAHKSSKKNKFKVPCFLFVVIAISKYDNFGVLNSARVSGDLYVKLGEYLGATIVCI